MLFDSIANKSQKAILTPVPDIVHDNEQAKEEAEQKDRVDELQKRIEEMKRVFAFDIDFLQQKKNKLLSSI